jgi:hypothetical protein
MVLAPHRHQSRQMDEVGRQRQIDKASKRQIEELKKFMVIRERRRIDKGEKKERQMLGDS